MFAFRVLGVLQVCEGAGVRIAIPRRKQRELLAFLLVRAGATVSTDEILDTLWGERPPASARANLHTYVSGLRRVIARATPDSGQRPRLTAGGYRLDLCDGEYDAQAFEGLAADGHRALARGAYDDAVRQLGTALGLWRGPVLEGLAHHEWAVPFAARLDQARWAAFEDQVEARLHLGQHTEVAAELREATVQQPLREKLWQQLMVALHRSGRRSEALLAYDRICRRLAKELGVGPDRSLRETHRRIRADDLGPPTAIAAVAADRPALRPVPAQLPAEVPLFTGRTSELAALSAVLIGGEHPPVCLIGGPGGIGKTWLALRWARMHRDRFADGQLFVNLRGFDPTGRPTPVETAVRGFLDAFGVPPSGMPADVDAQVGLYRSLVAGRRMLIVLDNARDAAQAAALLPGTVSCAVIVTSRNRLTGLVGTAGARPVHLDVLDAGDAHDLLVMRLGPQRLAAEPEAAAQMVAACGGLPLALGIAAARAAIQPQLALAAIGVELQQATTRLQALDEDQPASLRAALSWSWRMLTPVQRRVLGLLALAPGSEIGTPATAALTGLSPDAATAALRALHRESLLAQDAEDRWRMHDLVRLYGAERAAADLNDADREQSLLRVADFYVHTAHHAAQLHSPHRTPISLDAPVAEYTPQPLTESDDALTWLRTEHDQLLASQQLAVRRRWDAYVWQLAWSLDAFRRQHGLHAERLASWQAAHSAAGRVADAATRCIVHRMLGDALNRMSRWPEASDHLGRALALAEHSGDLQAQADVHRSFSKAYGLNGDDDSALSHAVRLLQLLEALHNNGQLAPAHNAIGWYSARLGRYELARPHLEVALTLARRHQHRGAEVDVLDSLGYLAHRTGEHDQALHWYRQCLAIQAAFQLPDEQADTEEHLGELYADLGEIEQARRLWEQALSFNSTHHRAAQAARVRARLDRLPSPAELGH